MWLKWCVVNSTIECVSVILNTYESIIKLIKQGKKDGLVLHSLSDSYVYKSKVKLYNK